MKFTLNRNYTLRTTLGHIITFQKGVPTHVPEECWELALGVGAEPENPDAIKMPTDPEDLPEAPTGAERKRQIRTAMLRLEKRNQRGDFTAGGAPHTQVLQQLVGFRVDQAERDQIWRDILVERAERDDAQTAA